MFPALAGGEDFGLRGAQRVRPEGNIEVEAEQVPPVLAGSMLGDGAL
jgi:hypothetical protein